MLVNTVPKVNPYWAHKPPREDAEVISVRVADLRDHPRLAAYQDDDGRIVEGDELAAIEILTDHTVVRGHELVEAARQLGQEEVLAILRRDLTIDNAELIIARDRLNHLGLSPTEVGQHYLGLLRLPDDDQRTSATELYKAAKRVASAIGVAVRDLSDSIIALAAPAAVREAYDAGVISARQVARVAQLPPDARAALDEEVRETDLNEAGQVIGDYLEAAAEDGRDPAGDYLALIEQLLDLIGELSGYYPLPSHIDPIRLGARQYTLVEYGHLVYGFGDRADDFDAREWLERLLESESEDPREST